MTYTLTDLIRLAGDTNQKNGYNGYLEAEDAGYGIQYLAMKDLLEIGENAEALEELRHGSEPYDVYYSGDDEKPEGYIIEKLDAVIRNFGTLYEVAVTHGIPLEEIEGYLVEKIEYNARRADTASSGVKKF